MEVDPWAVILRHSRWYLLCWSHTRDARRVLRVDRIVSAEPLPDTFTPPPGLDPLRVLEEHLSQGWNFPVDVLIDAPPAEVACWLPRSLGMLHAVRRRRRPGCWRPPTTRTGTRAASRCCRTRSRSRSPPSCGTRWRSSAGGCSPPPVTSLKIIRNGCG